MKLDRLRMIREELRKEFRNDSLTSEVYYHFQERWHHLDDTTDVSDAVASHLEKAKAAAVAFHAPKSRSAWFSCPNMHCAVSLEFATSPRVTTRKQFRERIELVLTRASNAYKVAHNPLTQLLAKEAFNEQLATSIQALRTELTPSSDVQGIEQQRVLALFALDLDHFKQVNDSHGHLYGDQVLKTFGMRLELASEEWKAAGNSGVTVALGHPSGEEFLISVFGNTTRDKLIEFGNHVRKKIDGTHLPSEPEWKWLQERTNLSMLVPPPLQERIITASIGLALHSSTLAGESSNDHVSLLLDQADTALYRAKSGGRNRVIAFDDILLNCGRVLEQDSTTGIVAIDIGKNVGVTPGQEFRVFPPAFTGSRSFQISDGRSHRTIGTYPRFNLTQITVFDVQPELSFAFVSDANDNDIQIEKGSHLEAVPLGSIGHLVPRASKYLSASMEGVRIGDIENVLAFVTDNSKAVAKPYAVALRFSRAPQYLKRYGPAALNAALARLYRESVSEFPAATIGILDANSIVVVGRDQTYNDGRLTKFVDDLSSELPELGLIAGVFCNADISSRTNAGRSLEPAHAIEFARFAASDHALTTSGRVSHFNYETALRILNTQRESRQFAQAQADFEKLRSLGLENANLLNMGGLILAGRKKAEQAADLFEKASQLDNGIVYKTNFATVATTPDQIERALRLLGDLSDSEIENAFSLHPLGCFSYARLLAQRGLSTMSDREKLRFALLAPRVLSLQEFQDYSGRDAIQRVFAEAQQ